MPETQNTALVAAIDCPGGGQVWIDGATLFVAHMNPPAGTSIYDVADLRHPRLAMVIEGVFGDTDHWRHFYIVLGLVWGLAAATQKHLRAARYAVAEN